MSGTRWPLKRSDELKAVDQALQHYEKTRDDLDAVGNALDDWAQAKGWLANGKIKTERNEQTVSRLINDLMAANEGLFGGWLARDIKLARQLCDPYLKRRVIGQGLVEGDADLEKYKQGSGQSTVALLSEIQKLRKDETSNIKPSAAVKASPFGSQEFWLQKGKAQESAGAGSVSGAMPQPPSSSTRWPAIRTSNPVCPSSARAIPSIMDTGSWWPTVARTICSSSVPISAPPMAPITSPSTSGEPSGGIASPASSILRGRSMIAITARGRPTTTTTSRCIAGFPANAFREFTGQLHTWRERNRRVRGGARPPDAPLMHGQRYRCARRYAPHLSCGTIRLRRGKAAPSFCRAVCRRPAGWRSAAPSLRRRGRRPRWGRSARCGPSTGRSSS